MERPESGDLHRRPELDRDDPAKLFSYAAKKQEWIKERVPNKQLPEAIQHLAEELEHYVGYRFDEMPELAIQSSDVRHMSRNDESLNGEELRIQFGPLPLEGDDTLLKIHNLNGTLYGFHRGAKNDIRALVTKYEKPIVTEGGIFTPLLSVGIEDSTIHFTEFEEAEKLEVSEKYIKEHLYEYDEMVHDDLERLLDILNNPNELVVKKLHSSSHVIADLAKNQDTSAQFIDAILDVISVKLGLDAPHDIYTRSHRIVMTESPVRSHKTAGEAHFNDVLPQLRILVESTNRTLALFFFNEGQLVQIPAKYITSIHKSK